MNQYSPSLHPPHLHPRLEAYPFLSFFLFSSQVWTPPCLAAPTSPRLSLPRLLNHCSPSLHSQGYLNRGNLTPSPCCSHTHQAPSTKVGAGLKGDDESGTGDSSPDARSSPVTDAQSSLTTDPSSGHSLLLTDRSNARFSLTIDPSYARSSLTTDPSGYPTSSRLSPAADPRSSSTHSAQPLHDDAPLTKGADVAAASQALAAATAAAAHFHSFEPSTEQQSALPPLPAMPSPCPSAPNASTRTFASTQGGRALRPAAAAAPSRSLFTGKGQCDPP